MILEIIKTISADPSSIIWFKISKFILRIIFIKSLPTELTLIKIFYA